MNEETKSQEPQTVDPAAGTGAFFTKPEVLEAIIQDPPLGDLPPGADGVEPRDTPLSPDAPKMERGEARHMSIPEASGILMELARKRSMSIDQVNALEMGVRRLMCRHFQRQRNWAKRREARLAEDGSPHPEPLTPAPSTKHEAPSTEEEAAQ